MTTFDFSLSKREKISLAIISLLAIVTLYYGWRLFWFLTDDAYIAFRYVSNSVLDYGYVWNTPPFRPVEGYTSFLWVVILDIVWRVTGIEPPGAANWLALFFSLLTLILVVSMTLLMDWNDKLKKNRLVLLVLILLGILTNRTFLAWTSSGLETSMFNFLVILWLFIAIYLPRGTWKWMLSISSSILLIYLTRPDGIFYFFATLLMLGLVLKEKHRVIRLSELSALLPLLGIPFHFLWRHAVYGEWLPNTYYAKVAGVGGMLWLESGYKYFLSFIIEYSLWIWIIIFIAWLIFTLRSFSPPDLVKYNTLGSIVPVFTILGHILYYTVIVGGDYFEYRVYSYLIPLLLISYVWFLNRLRFSWVAAISTLVIFIILSLPIPWMHWSITRNLSSRDETLKLVAPVAGHFRAIEPSIPGFLMGYLNYYDGLQEWLINHYVCVRHQELKALWLRLQTFFPAREEGERIYGDYPVIEQQAVGVIAWVLPHVNVIDLYGLNDYVIARNPNLRSSMRMAHLRMPPDGYEDCFLPNVKIKTGQVILTPRQEALTAEKIVFCEQYYLQSEMPLSNPGP